MFPFRYCDLYSHESRIFCRLLQESPYLRVPKEHTVGAFNIRTPLYISHFLSRLSLALIDMCLTHTHSEAEDEVGKARYRASHCEGTPEAGVY